MLRYSSVEVMYNRISGPLFSLPLSFIFPPNSTLSIAGGRYQSSAYIKTQGDPHRGIVRLGVSTTFTSWLDQHSIILQAKAILISGELSFTYPNRSIIPSTEARLAGSRCFCGCAVMHRNRNNDISRYFDTSGFDFELFKTQAETTNPAILVPFAWKCCLLLHKRSPFGC